MGKHKANIIKKNIVKNGYLKSRHAANMYLLDTEVKLSLAPLPLHQLKDNEAKQSLQHKQCNSEEEIGAEASMM